MDSPTCTAVHLEHGPCTRQGYPHERHASATGSWFAPTSEPLPVRLRRLADDPAPPTVDPLVAEHYLARGEALREAAEIAEVQQPSLAEVLTLLDRILAPRASYLSLQIFGTDKGDVAQLLPGAKVEAVVTQALAPSGFDLRTSATAEIGGLSVLAVHRRPATGAEVVEAADRRAARNREAGVIVPELLAGLGAIGAMCGAALLLRGLWAGGTLGPWILLALSALLAGVAVRRIGPPPAKSPQHLVLPEQASALVMDAIPQPREPLTLRQRQRMREARRQRGHMLTELLWGLFGCALLLSLLGLSGCDETPAAPPFVTGVEARPTCQPDGPPPPAPAEAPDTQPKPKPNKVRKTPLSAPLVGPNGERN